MHYSSIVSLNKPKVLIAGGTGFLGFNLSKKLLQTDSFDITIVDNFSTSERSNLVKLREYGNFDFIEASIEDLPSDMQINQIYNLACPASHFHYQENPIETWKASTFGLYSLLEIAKRNKATLLQASTSEIYGDPLQHPQKEEYWGNVNPIGVRSCYDEGKRAAESLIYDYRRAYGLDAKIVRIFNTYGPYMHPNDGRAVSNFIMAALKNETLEIYGDGTATRCFCFVDDLVDGLISAMGTSFDVPINLGSKTEIKISKLAEIIIKITKSSSQIRHVLAKSDDPVMRQPDLARATEILSWTSSVELQDGLEKTVMYFKETISSPADLTLTLQRKSS